MHIHWFNKKDHEELFRNVENRGVDYKYVHFACRCGELRGKYFPAD